MSMSMSLKHLLIVFLAEILVATTFAHVPFVRSSISDFLVAILLYHFVKVFMDVAPWRLAIAVFVFSCGVEMSQYFHLADALGLRRGSLLSILLGNSFSWGAIAMYGMGCLTSYFLDSWFLSRTAPLPARLRVER
jgi:hypothetical protein